MLENYLESYHFAIAHQGFSVSIDFDPYAYRLVPHERFFSQIGRVKASAIDGTGKPFKYNAKGAITQAQYHWLWSNMTTNIDPGFPNFSLDVWLPMGASRACGFREQYFGSGVEPALASELIAFNKEVGNEDDALTDAVQRGLTGGLPTRARYLRGVEELPIHFHRLYLEALRAPTDPMA